MRASPARANHELLRVLEDGQQALTEAADARVGSSPTPTPTGASWITIDPDNPRILLYHGVVDDGTHIINIPSSTIAFPDPANPRRIYYPLLETP